MSELPYLVPTHAYIWAQQYEIRDQYNRVIVRFQVLKGDLTYRKNLEALTKVLSALMNGEAWVENGVMRGWQLEADESLAGSVVPLASIPTREETNLPPPIVIEVANEETEDEIIPNTAPRISRAEIVGPRLPENIVDEEDLVNTYVPKEDEEVAVIGGARKKPIDTSLLRNRGEVNSVEDVPVKRMGRPKGSKNKK